MTSSSPSKATFFDYLALLRLDHATKHVFIVPGIVFALLLRGVQNEHLFLNILLGFLSALLIASANYTINEWLDRDSDKFHPEKSLRTAVQKELNGKLVGCLWFVLVLAGLGCAALANPFLLTLAAFFTLQGIVYNVPPLRSKDKAFLDVLSESINNPIRLLMGWAMIDSGTLPPSSILLAYWFGGAFLMAAKRFSEYRQITTTLGKDILVRYRKSFKDYTENNLATSCMAYALFSVAFLSVFLVKYRIEYILILPVIVALFSVYFALAAKPNSLAQKPEKLFKEKSVMLLVLLLTLVFLFASFVDIPALSLFVGQKFIEL